LGADDRELLRLHLAQPLVQEGSLIGLAFAVAIAVMAVVTLDVTSSGLEKSAAAIISVGKTKGNRKAPT
jgi:hypothetical protein